MIWPIKIETMEEYNNISSMGFNPLINWERFKIEYSLRKELELSLFGGTILGIDNIPKANQQFYKYAWENTLIKCCEECMVPLYEYSAIYISHILARGGYPELAHDLRNFNLLCGRCHHKWESDKSGMKIRKKNKIVINLMLNDVRSIT